MKEETAELIEKAKKVMLDYNLATGCSICFYDKDYKQHFPDDADNFPEKKICPHCEESKHNGSCQNLHINAIEDAFRKGSYHVYQCKRGHSFWNSPVFSEGVFSGAIRCSDVSQDGQKMVDIFSNVHNTSVMRNNGTSGEEGREKIQSLAEMTQLCAESLSSGSENYHEMLKRRTDQQEPIAKIIEELKEQYGENAEKPGYPLETEKTLMDALRRGDTAETKKTLNELLAMIFFTNYGQFKYAQLRITELVVLISRVEVNPTKAGKFCTEANNQNLKLVQEAKTIEELTDIIHCAVDRMLEIISSFQGIPHAAALRKAENFIMENFTRKISLKEIASIAGLSPPYFSTIFKEEMGENLSKYLNRLRVEKAGRLLLETDMSLNEIAARCCFEDQSWFSKIFKAYIGISPGKYRNQSGIVMKDNGEKRKRK